MAEGPEGREEAAGGVDPVAVPIALGLGGCGKAVLFLKALAMAQDSLPIVLVACIAVGSIVWNARVGLTYAPALPLLNMVGTTFAFTAIAVIFSTVFSNRVIVELATYFCLWANFPIFAVRFDYLSATLNFPLQDKLFARADSALGFDWLTWASIAWSHPAIMKMLEWAYVSYFYQPYVLVCLFAFCGPRSRNRELLTATVIAFLITVAISTLLPAFGPNKVYGIPSGWDPVLTALRAGTHIPLRLGGIVTFPSFHASMAVLLALAMRSNRYGFAAALLVNGLMLVSTVPCGYHYLVDLIAGCMIAVSSLYVARLMENRRHLRANVRVQT